MPKLKRLDLARCAEIAATCANFQLRKAARVVGELYDEALRPVGLRGTQFNLLVALALHQTATVTQLAKTLVVDRTTLTRGLAPLERDRLIESRAGEDGRERLLELTGRGRERLVEAARHWEQAQAAVVQRLGETRWRQLTSSLEATTARLGRT
jgi:DNA-binding MarR family transcriptional regulator